MKAHKTRLFFLLLLYSPYVTATFNRAHDAGGGACGAETRFKYVQGFTALETLFARIRGQLFHMRVSEKHVPFAPPFPDWRLIYLSGAVLATRQASVLFGDPSAENNRVSRVDRSILLWSITDFSRTLRR